MSNYSNHVTSGSQSNKSDENLEKVSAKGQSHGGFSKVQVSLF